MLLLDNMKIGIIIVNGRCGFIVEKKKRSLRVFIIIMILWVCVSVCYFIFLDIWLDWRFDLESFMFLRNEINFYVFSSGCIYVGEFISEDFFVCI